MPGLDGFGLAERLQEEPSTRHIPIIFVTALSQIEHLSHGLNLGAVDYLTKPFRGLELEARVNTALRLKFLQDDLRQANTELTELTLVDSLTGLKNHRFVTEYLEQTLLQAARYNEAVSAMMIDLDFFKRVNDSYGHPAGNEVRGLKPHQIAGRGMTRTFQHTRLFPKMSVLENIMVGGHIHSRGEFLAGMLHLPFTRKEERKTPRAAPV